MLDQKSLANVMGFCVVDAGKGFQFSYHTADRVGVCSFRNISIELAPAELHVVLDFLLDLSEVKEIVLSNHGANAQYIRIKRVPPTIGGIFAIVEASTGGIFSLSDLDVQTFRKFLMSAINSACDGNHEVV